MVLTLSSLPVASFLFFFFYAVLTRQTVRERFLSLSNMLVFSAVYRVYPLHVSHYIRIVVEVSLSPVIFFPIVLLSSVTLLAYLGELSVKKIREQRLLAL